MRRAAVGITAMLAALLASLPAATAYTAVAVSGSLAFGYCADMQSLGAAIECAMKYCRDSASDPQTCTIGLRSEPAGHYALAIGDGGWGVASAQTPAEAEREALDYCQRPGCRVVARWTEGIVRGQ